MANTSLLIKRSTANGKPATLNSGELAYSYASNVLFIGTSTGTNTYNIGGLLYTSTLDAATSANTASTLVKRDVNGAFQGTANNATQLATPRAISITGGDITAAGVNFDGSAAIALNAGLNAVPGLSAGAYGSGSLIPVITVAANGRVVAISTTAGAAGGSFNVTANTGGQQTVTAGNTLTLQAVAGSGLTTVGSANGNGVLVTFNTDTTILRSNTNTGVQTISSDLVLSGNVTILQSNIQSFNIQSTSIFAGDSLIQLASNNIVGDLVDIGFYGTSNTGSTVYHGLIREGSGGPASGQFFLFKNLTANPTGNVITYASASRANLVANLVNGIVANLASAIGIADGGTNNTTYTGSQHIIYDGTKFTSLANSTYTPTGTAVAANTVTSVTVDGYGRLTAATFAPIAISGSQVTTGLSASQIVISNGSALVSLANSTYTATGTPVAANTVTGLTVDAYGRVTAATFAPVAISAAQITSGLTASQLTIFNGTSVISLANTSFTPTNAGASNNTISSVTVDGYGRFTAATFSAIAGLTVAQGGTGAATFAQSGILYGNGTAALGVTAIAGGADQTFSNQILTVNASNVPTWASSIDGGQF